MSIIDGAAEQALVDFGEDFKPGTLTVPGERVSDGRGGYLPLERPEHPCLALVTDYSDYRRQTLGIPATDRQVLVLAASLPAGIVPAKGQKITALDPSNGLTPRAFEVIAKSGDPAGALFKLQAR